MTKSEVRKMINEFNSFTASSEDMIKFNKKLVEYNRKQVYLDRARYKRSLVKSGWTKGKTKAEISTYVKEHASPFSTYSGRLTQGKGESDMHYESRMDQLYSSLTKDIKLREKGDLYRDFERVRKIVKHRYGYEITAEEYYNYKDYQRRYGYNNFADSEEGLNAELDYHDSLDESPVDIIDKIFRKG